MDIPRIAMQDAGRCGFLAPADIYP